MRAWLHTPPIYLIVSLVALLAFLSWGQVYFLGDDWMVILCVASILGGNLITVTHRGYWWDRAGDISHEMFSQVQTALLNLPPGGHNQLWFVNLPDRIEYAYAFGNRVPFAIWLLQRQLGTEADVQLFRNRPTNVSPQEDIRQLLSEQAVQGLVVVFY